MTDYQTTLKDFSTQTVDPKTFWSQARSAMLRVEGGAFQIIYKSVPGLNRPMVQVVSVYFIPLDGTQRSESCSAPGHPDGSF